MVAAAERVMRDAMTDGDAVLTWIGAHERAVTRHARR